MTEPCNACGKESFLYPPQQVDGMLLCGACRTRHRDINGPGVEADSNQPLTIEWLREHVDMPLHEAWKTSDPKTHEFCCWMGHRHRLNVDLRGSEQSLMAWRGLYRHWYHTATIHQPFTIAEAIEFLRMAGVPMKGVGGG